MTCANIHSAGRITSDSYSAEEEFATHSTMDDLLAICRARKERGAPVNTIRLTNVQNISRSEVNALERVVDAVAWDGIEKEDLSPGESISFPSAKIDLCNGCATTVFFQVTNSEDRYHASTNDADERTKPNGGRNGDQCASADALLYRKICDTRCVYRMSMLLIYLGRRARAPSVETLVAFVIPMTVTLHSIHVKPRVP